MTFRNIVVSNLLEGCLKFLKLPTIQEGQVVLKHGCPSFEKFCC